MPGRNTRTLFEVGAMIQDAATVIPGPSHILFENGRIVESGPGTYVGDREGMEVHRYPDRIAIPGLVNTHGHAAMTLFRGAGDDVPLETWLNQKIFPLEAKLTSEMVYWGTQLACWEMMLSGTTCFTDMYYHMEESARATAESGLRALLSIGLLGFTEEQQHAGIQATRTFAEAWHGAESGRIQVALGPHAPYTCPPAFLEQIADLSEALHLGIQIHLSETAAEVASCKATYGSSPIQHVADHGLLGRPLLAAHCVHIDAQDIELMRRNDVRVAHNPQSNLKLGSGIAPLDQMLGAGLTVGLGTDGAASNNNLDMIEEMRLAALLHKGTSRDATVVSAAKAFQMATEDGAHAVFRPTADGTLRSGAAADMVLLDARHPAFIPNFNLISNVVYAAGAEAVTDVFVAGKQVLSGRKPVFLDTEKIAFEIERITGGFGACRLPGMSRNPQ